MQRFPGSSFVYVGDTVGDVHEAKEAGIPVIAVTWGYHTKEMLEKAQPTELVTSVTELKKVLLSKYS
jgi:phosphoglycolate phosphatase